MGTLCVPQWHEGVVRVCGERPQPVKPGHSRVTAAPRGDGGTGGGGEGRGCCRRQSVPTCSSPNQATQSVQSQAPASMMSEDEVPLTGRPGAPWIRLLWRLHLIPFVEQTDPNAQSLKGRGG